ncbi:MAG: ABC transporter permease [Deltaproteobacteria bacterium]|nr:ABC transporter permease [Deltaproteobacteria bacterium]
MTTFRVKRRQAPLTWGACLVLVGGVVLALGASGALLALQGKSPAQGLVLLLTGAFGSVWALEDCVIKAIPIFLCSLGVAVTFRLQIWNIGAEGQFALGAVGATWAALTFPDLHPALLLPIMFSAAALAGGFWGFVPGVLRAGLGVNEIIVTLMFNYLGILLMEALVYGPWKDPASFGMPMTPLFSNGATVSAISEGTAIHWGVVVCLIVGAALSIVFRFTRLGFVLQACGENVKAARYARFPYRRLIVLVMAVGGVLAGWAGLMEASATVGRLQPSIMAGYGYTAIIVAWLARLSPFRIALASFLLAGLRVGVENLQLELQVPAAFGGIVEGMILIFVLAAGFFSTYSLSLIRRP